MDNDVFTQKTIEHIDHLLQVVNLTDEQKSELRSKISTSTPENLEHLSDKLELIHRWELLEDLDNLFYTVEEDVNDWVDKLKEGILEQTNSDRIKEDQEKVKGLLNAIKEIQ